MIEEPPNKLLLQAIWVDNTTSNEAVQNSQFTLSGNNLTEGNQE